MAADKAMIWTVMGALFRKGRIGGKERKGHKKKRASYEKTPTRKRERNISFQPKGEI